MKFIATITDQAVIVRILTHLGLPSVEVVAAPARRWDDTSGFARGSSGVLGSTSEGLVKGDVCPRRPLSGRWSRSLQQHSAQYSESRPNTAYATHRSGGGATVVTTRGMGCLVPQAAALGGYRSLVVNEASEALEVRARSD